MSSTWSNYGKRHKVQCICGKDTKLLCSIIGHHNEICNQKLKGPVAALFHQPLPFPSIMSIEIDKAQEREGESYRILSLSPAGRMSYWNHRHASIYICCDHERVLDLLCSIYFVYKIWRLIDFGAWWYDKKPNHRYYCFCLVFSNPDNIILLFPTPHLKNTFVLLGRGVGCFTGITRCSVWENV